MRIPGPFRLILYLLPFLMLSTSAVPPKPVISIITDTSIGVMTSHGLDKLSEALHSKLVNFEIVTSASGAIGKKLIVVGLVHGNGLAAGLQKKGHHNVPKTAESLTIWKTEWKREPALVISGHDEKGVMYALLDVANLSGHWKDELVLLKKGLDKLKKQRADFKPAGPVKTSPQYKHVTDASNSNYFTINHNPVKKSVAGQPVTVKIQISSPTGLKWVRLQYRAVNQYKDFEMLPMRATGEKDTFEVTIPADRIDTNFNLMYLVEMMDNNGRGFIYPDFNIETPYKIVEFIRN